VPAGWSFPSRGSDGDDRTGVSRRRASKAGEGWSTVATRHIKLPPDEVPRLRVDLNVVLGFRDEPPVPLLEAPRPRPTPTLMLVGPPPRVATPIVEPARAAPRAKPAARRSTARWSPIRIAVLVLLLFTLLVGSLVAIFEGRTDVDSHVQRAQPTARA
jgi:hypothetical protein